MQNVMATAEPANLDRLRVVVVVRLNLATAINANLARAANQDALADRVLSLILCIKLLRVVVATALLVPFIAMTKPRLSRCLVSVLAVLISECLTAHCVLRATFIASTPVTLVGVSGSMNDLLFRHEPAY